MRRRLAVIVLAVTGMVTIAFLVPLAAVVRVVAADRALGAADQEARSLAGVLAAVPDAASVRAVVDQLNAGSPRSASVLLPDRSRVGGQFAVDDRDVARAEAGEAFTTSPGGGRRVWVPVRNANGTVTVAIVDVPSRLVLQGVYVAWTVLLVVGVLIVALGVVLADRLARSLVQSIDELADLTDRLQRGDLDARIVPSGPPEVAQVGVLVNQLATRIGELLEAERESAADLSHRLRTPLTALELEAGNLGIDDERARLQTAVRDLTEEVSRVIREAREPRRRAAFEACDLAEAVSQRVAFWSVLAEEQGRAWTVAGLDAPALVSASKDDVTVAIDALLDNVFAHTDQGVAFHVEVAGRDDGGASLIVADDGSGIEREDATMRGRSGDGSTGLGLDIVRRVAERSGGGLGVGRSASGGARIEVRFGA